MVTIDNGTIDMPTNIGDDNGSDGIGSNMIARLICKEKTNFVA
jgi:hypothetical protein